MGIPRKAMRWVVLLATLAIVASACGGDSEPETTQAATTTEATSTTQAATNTTSTVAATTTEAAPVGDLSTCPNPLVIQTAWFPEPEYAELYQLTGGEGSIDPESGIFSGPLAADPSITVEVRTGGPYAGYTPAHVHMYADDEVFLGLVPTDAQLTAQAATPVIGVMATMEKSPLGVMWDPATYTINSWEDVGKTGAVVNYFESAFWPPFVVAKGYVSEDQLDGSYDGSPSRFVSEEGAIIQQAYITQEPYKYENDLEGWNKPVQMLLVHDSGYEYYEQQLAIRADRLEEARQCLTAFIPLVQQATVDYMNDPSTVNATMLQAVEDLATFWTFTPESIAYSSQALDEYGIFANGANDTIGDFDMDRLNKFIEDIRIVPAFADMTWTAEDLVTNEFIDPSIGR